jgi:hypothetical protein
MRSAVIAAQSHYYVEKYFIDKGHTVDHPKEDYGIDMMVNTFDGGGYAEGGNILFQLKASDGLKYSKDGTYISFKVEMKHYEYWMKQTMPVFLVLYDAKEVRAYWLYVQAYFKKARKPKKNAASFTVRVPIKQRFTKRTVDYVQERKAVISGGKVDHED